MVEGEFIDAVGQGYQYGKDGIRIRQRISPSAISRLSPASTKPSCGGANRGHIIDWVDFAFGRDGEADSEWKGVDFLDSAPDVKSAWLEFWPQMGNLPTWDAVGRLESNSGIAYLLVEAKAHVEELQSSCKAKDANKQGGLDKIKDALKTTIPQEHSPFASTPASCFPCGSEPRFDSSITRTTDPRLRFLMLALLYRSSRN